MKKGRKMKEKDLVVEIPKRFKKILEVRFDPKYAQTEKGVLIPEWIVVLQHYIPIPCPLCAEYSEKDDDCGNCPFQKFEHYPFTGCRMWIYEILGKEQARKLHSIIKMTTRISWLDRNDKTARNLLGLLRKKVKKYIRWV